MKYSQTLNDDEYESSNYYIASQKETERISGYTNLNHIIGIYVPIYQLLNKLWTSLSLTQLKFKEYSRNNR